MLVYGIIPLALILLAFITWLALSRKSTSPVRRAALIALCLISLSVIVSLILIFSENVAVTGPLILEPGPEPVVQPEKEGSFSILIFAFLLLGFLALIIFLALRREKRRS